MSHSLMMPVRLSSEHGLDAECTLLRCQARASIVLARFTKEKLRMEATY